jgi:hypothetical protein
MHVELVGTKDQNTGYTNLDHTLHVGQLTLATRQFNIVGDVDSEGGEVAADNLTSEILLVLNN